jgi:hypothetical protein
MTTESTQQEDRLYTMLVKHSCLVDRLHAYDADPATIRQAQEQVNAMHARLARIADLMDGDREALAQAGVTEDQLDRTVASAQSRPASVRAARLRLMLHPDVIAQHKALLSVSETSGQSQH